MTVTIRAIEPDDFDEWHRLWTDYLTFYKSTLPEDAKRIAFDRLLSDAHNVHGLLALSDGKPVGLVHYIYHEHMWRPEGACYLQDLYADPNIRGTGAGRALIEAVYQAADAAGVPGVYWMTQDFNANARKLYDRIGKLSPFIKYDRT
ncbi:MAG: GNAT family N-acetyltransferase [Paracoccaceae bacterium]